MSNNFNRRLKFRVWCCLRKKYLPSDEISVKADGAILSEQLLGYYDYAIYKWRDHYDKVEVQLYIGVKDKNGKEIYEGDIVEVWSTGEKHRGEIRYRLEGTPMIIIYPAYFDGKFWSIHATEDKDGNFVDVSCEVIGNIFENPELLKS